LMRYRASDLNWPLPSDILDTDLELRLYPGHLSASVSKTTPDWLYVHGELKKKSVTKMLLWLEYKAQHPDGFQYTQFCIHYQAWSKSADLVFRNEHKAGDRVFIDYVGQTMIILDAKTGESKSAQIFIGVLGASNFTYAEASWSQKIPDWLGSHNRMFKAFGGVPAVLVPDNLKSAITKACRYDPVVSSAYYALAKHYDTSVIPARAAKPRDKAKAEAGVLLVERWILAALRNRKFFSLDELNQAIEELLIKLNSKKFQKLDGSRQSLFDSIDKPALKPLPTTEFEICDFKLARVNINYHVELERHNYSVPYQYVQKEAMIRSTPSLVEIFCNNELIATHLRRFNVGGYTTRPEHMPPKHQAHIKWSPERMISWVGEAGPNTSKVAEIIMASRQHPEQSYKIILGLIRMGEKFGQSRLENACVRAITMNTPYYRSIKNILKSGLDKSPNRATANAETQSINHENIRGPEYYLACAIAQAVCRSGYTVKYVRIPRFLRSLEVARNDGSYDKMLQYLQKTDLILFDDFGQAKLQLEEARDLLEVMDDRHGQRSAIITSQLESSKWYELIPDPTIADALLDRIIHRSHLINVKGPSMRKTKSGLTKGTKSTN
jgi:transposase